MPEFLELLDLLSTIIAKILFMKLIGQEVNLFTLLM